MQPLRRQVVVPPFSQFRKQVGRAKPGRNDVIALRTLETAQRTEELFDVHRHDAAVANQRRQVFVFNFSEDGAQVIVEVAARDFNPHVRCQRRKHWLEWRGKTRGRGRAGVHPGGQSTTVPMQLMEKPPAQRIRVMQTTRENPPERRQEAPHVTDDQRVM